eukprot:9484618-Pyramimonas_sp.AAC.2
MRRRDWDTHAGEHGTRMMGEMMDGRAPPTPLRQTAGVIRLIAHVIREQACFPDCYRLQASRLGVRPSS